jgi:hypothetical protein
VITVIFMNNEVCEIGKPKKYLEIIIIMKIIHIMTPRNSLLLTLSIGMGALVSYAEILYYNDFETDIAREKPNAQTLRPTGSNIGDNAVYPITAVAAGPYGCVVGPYSTDPIGVPLLNDGQWVRVYDFDTKGTTGFAENYVESLAKGKDAVHISLQFALADTSVSGSHDLRFTTGEYYGTNAFYLHAVNRRPFTVGLRSDGAINFYSDVNTISGITYDRTQPHQLDLYVNDNEVDTFTIQDGSGNAHTLYTNSATLLIDGVYAGIVRFSDTLNYMSWSANLCRLSFWTNTSSVNIDYLMDNISVESLETPDAVAVNWPVDLLPIDPPLADGVDYTANFMDDLFGYYSGELSDVSGWNVASGHPFVTIADGGLLLSADSVDVTPNEGLYHRVFNGTGRVMRQPAAGEMGPAVYAAFSLEMKEATFTGSDYFFAFSNPDHPEVIAGRVWVRKSVDATAFELGVSTGVDPSTVVWSSETVPLDEVVRVVVRYTLATNEVRLWLNPSTVSDAATPSVVADVAGDRGIYALGGIVFHVNEAASTGELMFDDLRVCGSFEEALIMPVEASSPLGVSQTPSGFLADGPTYSARLDGRGNIERLEVKGSDVLVPLADGSAPCKWEVVNPGEIGSSRMFGDRYFAVQTEYWLMSGSFDEDHITLILENNDDTNDSVYRLIFNPVAVTGFTTIDGVTHALPLGSAVDISGAVLINGKYQRTVFDGLTRMTEGTGDLAGFLIGEISIPKREVANLEIIAGDWMLASPQENQVFQRQSVGQGPVRIQGVVQADCDQIEVRFSGGTPLEGSLPSGWIPIAWQNASIQSFDASIEIPAGGWYVMELRGLKAGVVVSEKTLSRIGVGEVFVGAGQSNSTNNGSVARTSTSGMAVSFSGGHWQTANDPQPGNHDSSSKGSYYPAFLDGMADRFGVPVAIASTGQGASAVAWWQPDYVYDYTEYANYARHNGLYKWTLNRIKKLGPNGFRAVLWHQGESDSSKDAFTRTSEAEYYNRLKRLIDDIRTDAGWQVPWFVAQVSVWPIYTPAGDPNIRNAQHRIWGDGIAYEGAHSDDLGLEWRQPATESESRVHFTYEGLAVHGGLWVDRVGDYIEKKLSVQSAFNLGTEEDEYTWFLKSAGKYGALWYPYYPWVYANAVGWNYVIPSGEGQSFMYPHDSNALNVYGWLWSAEAWYPWFYSYETAQWIYLHGIENGQYRVFEHGTGNTVMR